MYGGTGNDTYSVGIQNDASYTDTIYESLDEGTDTLLFGEGIDPDDVRLWTDTYESPILQYSPTDQNRIQASETAIGESRVGEYDERSAGRRVGKGGVSTGRSRWSPD